MNDIRKLMEAIDKIDEAYDDRVGRLGEIYEEMMELVHEAEALVRGTSEERAASGYWLAQLKMALDNNHGYLGSGSHTLQDTIEALEAEDEEHDEQVGMDGDDDDDDDEDDGSLEYARKMNEM